MSDIEIHPFEDWMAPQVIDMFTAEYGRPRDTEEAAFTSTYESGYQRDNTIRVVAVDPSTDAIAGFQSYYRWPITYDGRPLRAYQSGRSIVAAGYRGRGIFTRLLLAGEEAAHAEQPADLFIGFPVAASYGALIKVGWTSPLSLQWFVRPLVRLPGRRHATEGPATETTDLTIPTLKREFAVSDSPEFEAWRRSIAGYDATPRIDVESTAGPAGRALLRRRERGPVGEWTIGSIRTVGDDAAAYRALLRQCIDAVLHADRRAAFLSIALNTELKQRGLLTALRRSAFVPTHKRILFTVKNGPVSHLPIGDPGRWRMFRADIDTW
jgi:GNAT superfamily N-acetyltransferase